MKFQITKRINAFFLRIKRGFTFAHILLLDDQVKRQSEVIAEGASKPESTSKLEVSRHKTKVARDAARVAYSVSLPIGTRIIFEE